jgi:hypothetical protein
MVEMYNYREGCWSKQLWSNLTYYSSIWMQVLRKTIEIFAYSPIDILTPIL